MKVVNLHIGEQTWRGRIVLNIMREKFRGVSPTIYIGEPKKGRKGPFKQRISRAYILISFRKGYRNTVL